MQATLGYVNWDVVCPGIATETATSMIMNPFRIFLHNFYFFSLQDNLRGAGHPGGGRGGGDRGRGGGRGGPRGRGDFNRGGRGGGPDRGGYRGRGGII